MFRDFFIQVSEALFYLQGGEMLINTLWIFPWILFWTLVIVLPLSTIFYGQPTMWSTFIFLIMLFPGLLMAMSPGLVQLQMMQECKNVESVIETKDFDSTTVTVKLCRVKENYYGDFSEWRIVGLHN